MKELSRSNLMYMRAFADAYSDQGFVQQLAGQSPWFHNCVLLDNVIDRDEGHQYIKETITNGWSRSVLA